MQRSIQTLSASGLPIEEYNQTQQNLTEATEALYSVLTTRGIRLYNAPDLREHVLNAVSVETPRGIRLSKQKTSNKIDGAVALSFAVLAAVQHGKPPTLEDLQNSPAANWKPEDSYFDPRAAPMTWK
jgi:phage terminase large subunit-like protein